MLWLSLLAISLTCVFLGKRLSAIDEVYALALYGATILRGLWGMALAPSSAQFLLGVVTLFSTRIFVVKRV